MSGCHDAGTPVVAITPSTQIAMSSLSTSASTEHSSKRKAAYDPSKDVYLAARQRLGHEAGVMWKEKVDEVFPRFVKEGASHAFPRSSSVSSFFGSDASHAVMSEQDVSHIVKPGHDPLHFRPDGGLHRLERHDTLHSTVFEHVANPKKLYDKNRQAVDIKNRKADIFYCEPRHRLERHDTLLGAPQQVAPPQPVTPSPARQLMDAFSQGAEAMRLEWSVLLSQ